MKISVCMATFNGALFVEEQISSILCQLNSNDELIIVDDCSVDNTVEIINSFNDNRIVLIENNINLGVNKSFSKSILLSTGDYIFLSDQDDIWIEGRINMMIKHLVDSKVDLLTSNFKWIDQFGNYTYVKFDGVSSFNSNNYFNNILDIFIGKTNYFGCAMLFTKSLSRYIAPFPKFIESHDLWIAKAGNLYHSQVHYDDITFYKRIHKTNVTSTTSNRKFIYKLFSRFVFILSIFVLIQRKIKLR
jgi:glycosyltransferase involved in cell wall biosynthesis